MKRLFSFLLLSLSTLMLFANSPLNFGLNIRLSMPRATYESTDWNNMFSDISTTADLVDIVDDSDKGYAGGAFLRLNKNKSFIHTEAMFSFNSSGFTALDGTTSDELRYTTESTVFNVPVYIGHNLIDSRVFKIRAFTGPSFSWIMKSSVNATRNGTEIEDFDSNFDLSNYFWLWSLGAGVELFIFSLDVRYSFDLTGVEGAESLEESFKQKTNMMEFTLGVKLF